MVSLFSSTRMIGSIPAMPPVAMIPTKSAEMTEIGLLKAAGAVAFSDGAKSVTNAQVMRRALTYARDFDALIVHHTEDPDLVGEGVMNEGEFAARLGLVGIPNAAEAVMLDRPPMVSPESARRVMECYLAADLSAEISEPVDMPLNNQALVAVQDLYKKFRAPV